MATASSTRRGRGGGQALEGDRVVRFKCYLSNTVMDALLAMGWVLVWRATPFARGLCYERDLRGFAVQVPESDPGPWDLYWCDTAWARETYGKGSLVLPEHARICHFPQHYELTRKDFMAKNLKAFRRLAEREPVPHQHLLDVSFSFVPETFWLPHDYGMFVESFKRQPGSVWIMKPAGSAQGRGIFLIRKLSEVLAFRKDYRLAGPGAPQDKPDQAYIVQRYLEQPYLIGGKKFDLRLYVLVTSYQPLVAWVYREGFARFSGFPYSLEDIGNSQVHLTNVAVQKKAEGYDKSKGCKWLMSQLRRYIVARHSEQAAETMLALIYQLFLTSLHAVQPRVAKDPRCFELYGFDVLLDVELKPHLIEVNASPALTADTPTDYALKRALLEDTFHVVDVLRRRTGQETRVGNFDLIWNNGPVFSPSLVPDAPTSRLNAHLGGCTVDRFEFLPA